MRVVGVDQVVYGSDRPVLDTLPAPEGVALREAMLTTNPERLLNGSEAPACPAFLPPLFDSEVAANSAHRASPVGRTASPDTSDTRIHA